MALGDRHRVSRRRQLACRREPDDAGADDEGVDLAGMI